MRRIGTAVVGIVPLMSLYRLASECWAGLGKSPELECYQQRRRAVVIALQWATPLVAGLPPCRAARIVKDADKSVYDAASGKMMKPDSQTVCELECIAVAGQKNAKYCRDACEGEAIADEADSSLPRVATDADKSAFERFTEASVEGYVSFLDNLGYNPKGQTRGVQPDSISALR